jgi:hypothetical protein
MSDSAMEAGSASDARSRPLIPTAPAVPEAPAPTAEATPDETAPLVIVTAHFKLVFICVTAITVFTLLACVSIGIFVSHPTEATTKALDLCSTIAASGFGALVGLLSGKAMQ